jgi:hypothetical protein
MCYRVENKKILAFERNLQTVFQFTQKRVLKRIFASLRLFWFAIICGYRGTFGCVIARES